MYSLLKIRDWTYINHFNTQNLFIYASKLLETWIILPADLYRGKKCWGELGRRGTSRGELACTR